MDLVSFRASVTLRHQSALTGFSRYAVGVGGSDERKGVPFIFLFPQIFFFCAGRLHAQHPDKIHIQAESERRL